MEQRLLLYYPLLDPVMEDPDGVLETYIRHGCRHIEVALPCRNPRLDGAVIRDSMSRILERHELTDMFSAIRGVKERFPGIRVQLMSYAEIVEETGVQSFAELCQKALVDDLLVPDASLDQLAKLDQVFAEIYDIPVIRFLPYTGCQDADLHEMGKRAERGKGYLFLQSGNAKSGGCQEIGEELKQRIAGLRKLGIRIPVFVGFGIRNREQIQACLRCGADGAVIGSGLIGYIASSKTEDYLSSLTAD